MADPAVFDWAAYLAQCGTLLVESAAWVMVGRTVVHALGFIGR